MPPARLLAALAGLRVEGRVLRDWTLLLGESRQISLGIKDREVGNPHAPLRLAESCSAQFRLIWDDDLVSRGTLERSEIEGDPHPTLSRARAAAHEDPDGAYVASPAPLPDVPMWDACAADLAEGRIDPWGASLASVRRRVEGAGVRTWSGTFWAGQGRSAVATSAGVAADSTGTTAGWHITLNGQVGTGRSARAPEDAASFEARLDRLLDLAERLERPAPPVATGVHPVVLHPRVVEDYVIDTLFANLGGSAVAHGESHFRREQFGGPPVLREDLDLRIDPLLPLRAGSYRYTGEGVPARPCAFIERGRLITPLLDLKYARRLGLAPTPGPGGADTTFLEGPPPLSPAAAMERARGGVLVPSVLGVHTQDSASGDFSLAAPQALALGPRGPEGRVPVTLSGNLFAALRDPALEFVCFDGEHTPGLLLTCRVDPR